MKKTIRSILSMLTIVITLSILQSCNNCEENCDNGYCSDGTCECLTGWKGVDCDQKITGSNSNGNCNSTPYYGLQGCNSSGYVRISSTACCSSSYPYHNSATSSCYTSCDAAYSADNSGYISYGTGQTSNNGNSGNSGYNCNGSSCSYVSSGASYSSQSACESDCGNTNPAACDWSNALSGLSVTVVTENICGNQNDKRVVITNNYSQKVKLFVCVQRDDGTYSAWGDSVGTEAGDTWSGGYACSGTGNYIIYAEFFDIYWANNSCSYPGCN